ncbi:MAG: hypothetical protein IH986_10810 [Planctomycetes bacterium]|nr:hypothetical protein [Planctomycetota bacterium]
MALIEVNWKPERSQLRGFGFICLVAFGVLGIQCFVWHHLAIKSLEPGFARGLAYGLWAAAAVCGILALAAPALLRPLYVALTAVSLPIGFVLSHVIMAVFFYLIFTPLGLLFRVMGRDPLCRTIEPDAKSYWVRREPVTDVKRYFRQF